MPPRDAAAVMPRGRCWRHCKRPYCRFRRGPAAARSATAADSAWSRCACAGRCLCGHGTHVLILYVTCTGLCSLCKTLRHWFAFQCAYLRRKKTAFGFRTGDMVTATLPSGKGHGVHKYRIPIRLTGNVNMQSRCARRRDCVRHRGQTLPTAAACQRLRFCLANDTCHTSSDRGCNCATIASSTITQ